MNTTVFEQFDVMDNQALATVEGGKTTYYGNGLYCNQKKCWADWGQTINSIAINSAMNWATQGNAGWHSGGVA